MKLLILADEGLNGKMVRELRERGFKVDWILEIEPGMSDEKVIELAKEQQQALITDLSQAKGLQNSQKLYMSIPKEG